MADLSNNTVQVAVSKKSKFLEPIAFDEIYPGMLLAWIGEDLVRKHNVSSGVLEAIFATENVYHGKTIFDPYPAGYRVMARLCRHGDEFIAWAAAGSSVNYADHLVSNGDGTLISIVDPLTVTESAIVGVAAESLGPVGSATRLKINIY
jgi:hypothetical protein